MEKKEVTYEEERYGKLYITDDKYCYSVYWEDRNGIENFIGCYKTIDIARGVIIGFKTGMKW